MELQMDIDETLYTDEAVCFIADRHGVTPRQLLSCFLVGASPFSTVIATSDNILAVLEPNEVEILKGLVCQAQLMNTNEII